MKNSVLYCYILTIEKGYIMKKLIFLLAILWLGLTAFSKSVQANDYNTAVVAHIIKEKISGNNVDTSVLEAEMHKLAYQFSLEMVDVLEKHLPNILESIAADIRLKADSKYKCALLKDTKIADKECS